MNKYGRRYKAGVALFWYYGSLIISHILAMHAADRFTGFFLRDDTNFRRLTSRLSVNDFGDFKTKFSAADCKRLKGLFGFETCHPTVL